MPTPYSRAGDATEPSEDHPAISTIRAAARERGLHRLSPQHTFPTEPRHLRPHRMPKHARDAVISREGEVCFQVDRVGLGEGLAPLLTRAEWARSSSSCDGSRG